MGLSVHQISPKPLPLEPWNSHTVHDNDQINFKTNFTVHFKNYIENNSANRLWRKAQTIAAIWFG